MYKITLILFIFSIINCGSLDSLKISKEKDIQENKNLIISFEKTPCFGKCPIYKIILFNDGSGIYHGIKFTDNLGKHHFYIKKSELKSIIDLSKKIKFNLIEENKYFNSFIQDLPSTIITIKNHQIKYNENVPEELINLENYIYNTSIKSAFKKN